MNAMELNAQIWRDIAEIADDEALMMRLVKYLKRLTAKKNDPTEMTYEELVARVQRGKEQYARGECSEMLPGEDLTTHLRRLGYAI